MGIISIQIYTSLEQYSSTDTLSPLPPQGLCTWYPYHMNGLFLPNTAHTPNHGQADTFPNLSPVYILPFAKNLYSLHFYHQCFLWSGVLVAQSCPALCESMDCSLPGSSAHGILQARILKWAVVSFSRGSSRPRDQTRVSCTTGRLLTISATGKCVLPLLI